MKPEERSSSQNGTSLPGQGQSVSEPTNHADQPSQEAAAQVIRSQIDSLYENKKDQPATPVEPELTPAPLEDVNPYQRTHSEKPNLQANDWSHYHSAWQNYYQKYYEGYYLHHLNKARQVTETSDSTPPSPRRLTSIRSKNRTTNQTQNQSKSNKIFTTDEAIFDMRQELIGKVQRSATKIRKSRHFLPIISGLIVVLIFAFLQYNSFIISNVMAYVSPGSIDPQNIIIDPNANTAVGPDPRVIIPKINVDVPVFYDIPNTYSSLMSAMAKGLAQFVIPGASSHPGQVGNTVLSGHSSNDLFDTGDYKFIFAQLDNLNVGDTIYANYHSVRYTYIVTKKQVVSPNDVSVLVYPTTKPVLTLVTCTPVGTALNRLLVTAEQVSPDPSSSTAAPASSTSSKTTVQSIPGNSPSLLEKLFGAK
ncbi:MAG TPA: sortase [Candidatus Saccharimonadales bacterium]|nr:sortase [Candidatus Saccharimonadales bacterium]